ncbi:acyltransferase [uncultured Flavobacterium sp.]|uniref:acyltransferase n=1 Tax=uncultured Flavobacterium sp. TaxID=165435 RepID=UPI0025E1D3E4|nr:acyltransferase [uncultured Flavobacterium sp.]
MGLRTLKVTIEWKLKAALTKLFLKNIHIGNNVRIDYHTKIYNKGQKIVIGDKVYLRSKDKGYQAGMPFPTTLLIDVKNAEITIGKNCRINGAYIHAQKGIRIGDNCVIASGVNILDSNGHELYSADRTVGRDKPEEIILGDNIWIGLNAIILKGTTIGKNSVVSAGSIVKGSFPENSLIAGNPAKVVKTLDIPL